MKRSEERQIRQTNSLGGYGRSYSYSSFRTTNKPNHRTEDITRNQDEVLHDSGSTSARSSPITISPGLQKKSTQNEAQMMHVRGQNLNRNHVSDLPPLLSAKRSGNSPLLCSHSVGSVPAEVLHLDSPKPDG